MAKNPKSSRSSGDAGPLPLRPTLAPLPDLAVCQLRAAFDNLNQMYGLGLRPRGFKVLGLVGDDDARREVIEWIADKAIVPCGDMLFPRSIQLVRRSEAPDLGAADHEAFQASVAERVHVGDFAVRLTFDDPALGPVESLAVVNDQGIQYDALLFGFFTIAQGQLPPDSACTDCEWWRFGWIWQSGFANMTRGEVKICLTVVCDNAGRAIDCLSSRHCFMQLGDCSTQIANVRRVGNCCRALCAWGVATGTVGVKVTLTAGRLTVTFSGTLGSTAQGGRSLRDCCPPRQIVPTSTQLPADTEDDDTVEVVGAKPCGCA
jgi:hypothetical protein